MDVGKNIRDMRKMRGLNQESLGKLIGVKKSTISRWESGERDITLQNVQNIATALKIPIGALLTESITYEKKHGDQTTDIYVDYPDTNDINNDNSGPRVGIPLDDPNHQDTSYELVMEEDGNFSTENTKTKPGITFTIPDIDDPELIQAFEGFKDMEKLTPEDQEDIKNILIVAKSIIDKRTSHK